MKKNIDRNLPQDKLINNISLRYYWFKKNIDRVKLS